VSLKSPDHIVELLLEHIHLVRLIEEVLGGVADERQIEQHAGVFLLIVHVGIVHEVLNLLVVASDDFIVDTPVVLLENVLQEDEFQTVEE
jgi:hypothetical protein